MTNKLPEGIEPREYWITQNGVVFNYRPTDEMKCKGVIHVIEYAAFSLAQEQIKELVAERDECRAKAFLLERRVIEEIPKYIVRRDKLQEQIKELVEGLEKMGPSHTSLCSTVKCFDKCLVKLKLELLENFRKKDG